MTGTKNTESALIGSGSIYSNPEIFKIMLAQMINGSPSDLEILFGNDNEEEENSSDWFLGSSIFSNNPLQTANLTDTNGSNIVLNSNLAINNLISNLI
ncbi:hypothetical protein A2276_02950 [candidate division WOR-1 bacterium RIFOXYA12_FULL_43_27]|uniref:Uncharacterized protein n=1 Tax=candidate division WOR-1 bacterium RIFOXYC2_FULL_46_14 TaxID=1802587 RepID=A0A1F4U7J6_UNCSA|nr:MAG: hypothetical protein A2276_02950 [candidate division WOR-1 bacterium RIFOXYA12_FULL_43_27]OGC19336.1 MAG: hypothetical protein A2292_01385 [candidate division WOR-1 bacterium RIFOXYB2_FULL_46_45]OGC30325.1 MAG: hypothetical protein A2232_01385 [candidate division WOR-1 bacterium RIFOXYA2_FULL_46_56]OGC40926.1 MAG: hypothetical protein A2438_01385 [candidate division WOR-1 bacterium RIFOXYC2_FULL_46_14]